MKPIGAWLAQIHNMIFEDEFHSKKVINPQIVIILCDHETNIAYRIEIAIRGAIRENDHQN